MKRYRVVLMSAVLLGLLIPGSADAITWYIKPDGTGMMPTIQAGVTIASDGDIVLLAPGTFTGAGNRDVDFMGKAITVTSEGGPDVTIIDCQGQGRGFLFESNEVSSSVLSGVTIKNGSAAHGGAIVCSFAQPTITGNHLVDNSATYGGAIYCVRVGGTASIAGNTFCGNSATYGGAIYNALGSPAFTGNTLSENSAPFGGGIYNSEYAAPLIEYTIIAFSTQGQAMLCEGTASLLVVNFCNIFGNAGGDRTCGSGSGNLSSDPQFCGILGSRNYYLQSDSPCLPENNPFGVHIGAWPLGCGTVGVEETTWGRLKSLYRE